MGQYFKTKPVLSFFGLFAPNAIMDNVFVILIPFQSKNI